MAHVERVPVTRLVTIGGYITDWELEGIIRGLDDDVNDDYSRYRGKVKITIEYMDSTD